MWWLLFRDGYELKTFYYHYYFIRSFYLDAQFVSYIFSLITLLSYFSSFLYIFVRLLSRKHYDIFRIYFFSPCKVKFYRTPKSNFTFFPPVIIRGNITFIITFYFYILFFRLDDFPLLSSRFLCRWIQHFNIFLILTVIHEHIKVIILSIFLLSCFYSLHTLTDSHFFFNTLFQFPTVT